MDSFKVEVSTVEPQGNGEDLVHGSVWLARSLRGFEPYILVRKDDHRGNPLYKLQGIGRVSYYGTWGGHPSERWSSNEVRPLRPGETVTITRKDR